MPRISSRESEALDCPQGWTLGTCTNGKPGFTCIACNDGVWRERKNILRHEESAKHKRALAPIQVYREVYQHSALLSTPEPATVTMTHDGPLMRALKALNASRGVQDSEATGADYEANLPVDEYDSDDPFVLPQDSQFMDNAPSYGSLEATVHELVNDAMNADYLDLTLTTYSDDEESAPESLSDGDMYDPAELEKLVQESSSFRARNSLICNSDSTWFPWPDKSSCVLDILRHMPRSTFSDKQNGIIQWALERLGVNNAPTDSSMKSLTQVLQYSCGIRSIRYQGALGHVYYVNDLLTIIAQELSNPKVRPYLEFYPEDGPCVGSAHQAKRWLHNLEPELATPMMRRDGVDYFVFEPVVLSDQSYCMPFRWFKRKKVMFAQVWSIIPVRMCSTDGWIVLEHTISTVPLSHFSASYIYFCDSYIQRGVPSPKSIIGSIIDESGQIHQWTRTNPRLGNRWRIIASGHRVLAFPIWLYCDDTSGNSSKRWNKHNSYLFTAAGLPYDQTHLEYNIHFLSTSNIAPPLEMMEGIVEQLELGQLHGVWSWDCVLREIVLVVPFVLALLGDNPMQSELSCHVGLGGNLFCRACLVDSVVPAPDKVQPAQQGDAVMLPAEIVHGQTEDAEMWPASDANIDSQENHVLQFAEGQGNRLVESAPARTVETEDGITADGEGQSRGNKGKKATSRTRKGTRKKKGVEDDPENDRVDAVKEKRPANKGKRIETKDDMIIKARKFVQVASLRSKLETAEILQQVYVSAKTVGGLAKAKELKTVHGVKDNYQEYFIDKIASFATKLRGKKPYKQALLDRFTKDLPQRTTNPLWRLKGIDAHQDTPVEVLHVVLLGFVKYFWRDAMARLNNNDKSVLMVRLSSVNVRGLSIAPLAGKTLVQYAGSLVGRDFRSIVQVAPFVLYGLLPEENYNAWLALCTLIPWIWQPVIYNVSQHTKRLAAAIEYFLCRTAQCTSRWFNKPKFHVILHLVQHIIEFGPAILFATEKFESYNALIRDYSIHSNRQAPSRDIAKAFANVNRIRHLTSGGKFFIGPMPPNATKEKLAAISRGPESRIGKEIPKENNFQVVGKDAEVLIQNDSILRKFCGIPSPPTHFYGSCKKAKKPLQPWSKTLSSKVTRPESVLPIFQSYKFIECLSCNLQNDDVCEVGEWVIGRQKQTEVLFIGKIAEIIQISRSTLNTGYALGDYPDYILLSVHLLQDGSKYGMPKLVESNNYVLAEFKDVICSVNVQHNCAAHNCNLSNTRHARQERELIASTLPSVNHIEPDDVVLNCAKMRDFRYLQEFCVQPEPIDMEEALKEGVERELKLRQARKMREQENLQEQLHSDEEN